MGTVAEDWAPLSTGSFRVGVACTNATTTCAPGYTLHQAWTAIYGSIVTIDDPTPPIATGAFGTLLTSPYVTGTVTAGVASATDSTGIRALQVRADGGTVLTQVDRACDFTRRAPCSDVAVPAELSLDARALADGVHTVQVGVLDAAGNFAAAATQSVTVDNGAPAEPAPVTPTALTTPGSSATIRWTEPAGQVAPITTAHVAVCKDRVCTTSTQPAGAGSGSATVPLARSTGRYTVTVSLSDAAGNHAPGRVTTWTIDVPALTSGTPTTGGTPPTTTTTKASPRLTVARPSIAVDRRTITVRGTTATTLSGRVTVRATARIAGRTRTATTRVTPRRGRFTARVRLPSTRWRTARVTVRHPGNATHRAATVARTLRQRAR